MKNFKIIFITFSVILIIFYIGCSKEDLVGVNNSNTSKGGISLNILKADIPTGVQQLRAELSRLNYDTLRSSAVLNNDSLIILSFEAVPVGEWHLRVDAKNSENKIIYSGAADVTILEDQTIDVYLTLTLVGTGSGNINIHVNWGSSWIDYPNNPVFTINDSPIHVLVSVRRKLCLITEDLRCGT